MAIPKFIRSDRYLIGLLVESNLSWDIVYKTCLNLGIIKQIAISDQTIEEWYKEFLKAGWTKEHFLKQYEALKTAETYGRVDYAMWVKSERMYSELELKQALEIEIQKRISRGEKLSKLMEKPKVITEQQEKDIRLYEANQANIRYNLRVAQELQEIQDQERTRIAEIEKDKEIRLRNATPEQRRQILTTCKLSGCISCSNDKEFEANLRILEHFSRVIPVEIINRVCK